MIYCVTCCSLIHPLNHHAVENTCEVYADGSVKMLNGTTVFNELTKWKSVVATVDKAENNKNDDPCKFSLMIQTDGTNVGTPRLRIRLPYLPEFDTCTCIFS